MTAHSSVLLLFCWILGTTMGSEPDPVSLLGIRDSVTSLQQKVLRLEGKMSSMEDSLSLMIRGENEQMLITVLDKMAKDSKNYASIDKVSEMGEALREELRALLSPHISRMQEFEERVTKQKEGLKSLVTCASEPPSPQNGRPVDFERKHGSEVGYTCDRNFVMTRNSTVRCHFGTWEGKPPVCTTCPEGKYGSSCHQTCHCARGSCNPSTGACSGGCARGWTGQSCQIPARN